MKNPSTGNFRQPDDPRHQTPVDHPSGASKTRTSVDGEPSPRLPHERDESSDTAEAPNPVMETAYDDAVSDKEPTDRSTETNAAYERLRDPPPAQQPDEPK